MISETYIINLLRLIIWLKNKIDLYKENYPCDIIWRFMMDILKFIANFPWNRFGHAYGNASDLKEKFIKIINGNADEMDYQFIINRLEHQETLFWITPLLLKVIIILLDKALSNKKVLLEHIKILFEAANYNIKVNIAKRYKPSNKMLEKYTHIKKYFFDEAFDGKINIELLKMYKSLDRNFMQIIVIDYISYYKIFLESFMKSKDTEIAQAAVALINSVNNPKKYLFIGENEEEIWI